MDSHTETQQTESQQTESPQTDIPQPMAPPPGFYKRTIAALRENSQRLYKANTAEELEELLCQLYAIRREMFRRKHSTNTFLSRWIGENIRVARRRIRDLEEDAILASDDATEESEPIPSVAIYLAFLTALIGLFLLGDWVHRRLREF